MKKLFSIACTLMCLILATTSVSAASTNVDPYKVYQTMMNKVDKAKSVDLKTTVKQTLKSNGIPVTFKYTAKATELINDDGKFEMNARVSYSSPFRLSYDLYYRGGYFYQNIEGSKIKVKEKISNTLDPVDDLAGLTQADFKNATIEKTSEGDFNVKLRVKDKDFENALTQSITSALGITAQSAMSEVYYTIVTDNKGNLKSYNVAYAATVLYDGDTTTLQCSIATRINSFNTVSRIDFPADLSSYKSSLF